MKPSFRKSLKHLTGQRLAFSATISRYGKKSAFRGEPIDTVLLVNISRVDPGEVKDDLAQDMLEVLTSFCARLYGRRSARNKAKKALEAIHG